MKSRPINPKNAIAWGLNDMHIKHFNSVGFIHRNCFDRDETFGEKNYLKLEVKRDALKL